MGYSQTAVVSMRGDLLPHSTLDRWVDLTTTTSPSGTLMATIDGTRKELVHVYGTGNLATLPPGDYLAIVELGGARAETPFTVKGGERVDVPVILNAGVLAMTATGATELQVFGKKDINGNAKSVYHDYADTGSIVLPPGDYTIIATRGEASTETQATVKAGERSEVAVP
jgi:Ca-activated chloride channel family protein